MPRLECLRLEHNLLHGTLEASVVQLVRLQVLTLDDNNLSALPPGLGRLPALRELSVARNRLEGLPESIGGCKALRVLSISGNPIRRLPDALFSQCASLQELWARNNHLEALPSTLSLATALQKLDVGSNCLSVFPDLSRLVSLEGLWCFGNHLTALPTGLDGCVSLRILNLDGNRLSELGTARDGIARLRSLRILSAAENAIKKVGPELGNSKTLAATLHALDLRGNGLVRIPTSLGRLRSLATCQILEGNQTLSQEIRRIFSPHRVTKDSVVKSPAVNSRKSSTSTSTYPQTSVTSEETAALARTLSDALDYLQAMDDELEECRDWSPGFRRKSQETGTYATATAERRAPGSRRRASVWGFWRGAASRGGGQAVLDGGPGLRGIGREDGGDGDAAGAHAFLGVHGWNSELGARSAFRDYASSSLNVGTDVGFSLDGERQLSVSRPIRGGGGGGDSDGDGGGGYYGRGWYAGREPRLTMGFTKLGSASADYTRTAVAYGSNGGDGTSPAAHTAPAAAAVSRLARRHSLELMEGVDVLRGAPCRRAFFWGYCLDVLSALTSGDVAVRTWGLGYIKG